MLKFHASSVKKLLVFSKMMFIVKNITLTFFLLCLLYKRGPADVILVKKKKEKYKIQTHYVAN